MQVLKSKKENFQTSVGLSLENKVIDCTVWRGYKECQSGWAVFPQQEFHGLCWVYESVLLCVYPLSSRAVEVTNPLLSNCHAHTRGQREIFESKNVLRRYNEAEYNKVLEGR